MVKRASLFLFGLLVGGGMVWGLGRVSSAPSVRSEPEKPSQAVVPAAPLSCDGEVAPLRRRVEELEGRLANVERPVDGPEKAVNDIAEALEVPVQSDAAEEQQMRAEAIKWRVSAIEKFVPLTAAQKDRLSEKFKRESESNGEEPEAETLDDILGAESASFYRQQVSAAFQRVQDQEVDKEVVWISRQLSLSADQERSVRSVYSRVESEVQKEFGGEGHGTTPRSAQDRVKLMVQENKRRRELINSQMKDILSPEQYQAYLRNEAESAASDVEVFHDPG